MRHILTVDKMSYHKSFSVILYKLCRYTMYRHERYNKGKTMTKTETRQAVLNRDNCRCRACGFSDSLTMEVDHIVPRTLGGSNDIDNLQALCSFCNNTKANIQIPELPIREACDGFGEQSEVTENRLNFRQHIADIRQQQTEELTGKASEWKTSGARTLTIRKRLDKLTTSGIVQEILTAIR